MAQAVVAVLGYWAQLEEHYGESLYDGGSDESSLRVVGNRNGRLVFTAPHAVNHIREHKVKYAERGTGGLAELLALSSNNQALTVDGPLDYDPNWDQSPDIPFKRRLLDLLTDKRAVVDLHGMKDDYGIDVCVGQGRSPDAFAKQLADCLVGAFKSVGFRVEVDWPFDGRRIGTITDFVQERGFSACQVEIAARLRYPKVSHQESSLLIDSFISAIRTVQECY